MARSAGWLIGVVLCGLLAWPTGASGAEPSSIAEGQDGRALLGGRWLFRRDDANEGIAEGFMRERSTKGWRPVAVPHDFNATETATNRSSVGWYRRDLRVREGDLEERRIVRFEGAGHFSTVYLNGRKIARHAGGYLPFEADLRGLRPGVNRLVVRVSSLRARTDLSHWRPASLNGYGNGGWWNFGGIHREVTIRRARGLDIERVQAMPRQACPTCEARVSIRATLRNLTPRKARAEITIRAAGRTLRLTPRHIGANSRREVVTKLRIAEPRLWGIRRGNLYRLSMHAQVSGSSAVVAPYRTSFGVRHLSREADGSLLLNGSPLSLQGVSVHEDDPQVGAAWGAPQRDELLRRIDELGADVVRAHYPLHPAVLEALDRRGVLVWSQAPVYQVQNDRWELPAVRRSAVALNAEVVMRDRGHPSVLAYSMANELTDPVTPAQAMFIRSAAARIRALDPTRLVAIDRVARFGAASDADPVWREVDALGVNEYFGWYRGALPPRPEATIADLGPYLDELHRLQPHAALFTTEFGAEATRDGPDSEKGTYSFQAKFLREHLAIAASRPFVNGAMIWALRDFRVMPGWTGGNPFPDPPYNHKGLLDLSGQPKPAYWEVQRIFGSAR